MTLQSRYKIRRRLAAAHACLLVLAMASFVGLVAAQAAVSTTIVGGTTTQQEVLRQIVARLGPTRLPQIQIVPAAGGVKLQIPVEAIRPSWDALVIGGAFLQRSVELGLPPLREIDVSRAGWPTSNAGGIEPPLATALQETATRRAMLHLVHAWGVTPAELSISKPFALAVALRVRVNNAASFLHYQLRSFMTDARRQEARYEGLYIEIDDNQGATWISTETRFGGDSYVRPSLRGCVPLPTPIPTPTNPNPIPPCPS
jgi:hypothetical protein